MLKAIADRLAEAFAEWLHQKVRREYWGYATRRDTRHRGHDPRGIPRESGPRPAIPACPDHEVKAPLFALLQAPKIGMTVTESYAMLPAASVSGFYLAHPEATYFAVGKIGEDQLDDFARRDRDQRRRCQETPGRESLGYFTGGCCRDGLRIVVLGGYGNFGGRICRSLATEKESGSASRDETRRALRALSASSARRRRFARPISDRSRCAGFFRGAGSTSSRPRHPHFGAVSGAVLSRRRGRHRGGLALHRSGRWPRLRRRHRRARRLRAQPRRAGDERREHAARGLLGGHRSIGRWIRAHRAGRDQHRAGAGRTSREGDPRIDPFLLRRPFAEWNNGRWKKVFGWQGLRRMHYADLGLALRGALRCPDLELLPARYTSRESVRFDASLELVSAHVGLWTLAWLTRMKLIREPAAMTKAILRMARRLDRFGSDVGGMRVMVAGRRTDGKAGESTWHLTARKGDGPAIPCIPATCGCQETRAGRGASARRTTVSGNDDAGRIQRRDTRSRDNVADRCVMTLYEIAKLVHILGTVPLFGTAWAPPFSC